MEYVGFVYMVKCADEKYYIGSHRGSDLAVRISEHNLGLNLKAYTFRRRPVELVWSEQFLRYDEMISVERQLKGWGRAKKEALIEGDYSHLQFLSKRKSVQQSASHTRPSRLAMLAPQDKGLELEKQLSPHSEVRAQGASKDEERAGNNNV